MPTINRYQAATANLMQPNIAPTSFWPQAGTEACQVAIRAAYKQVFGNIGVMESERLFTSESRLTNGERSIREFITELGCSELYRRRFFETCSPHRFVELNFKHFLGRAPQSEAEVSGHVTLLQNKGLIAEIESYTNCEEYLNAFGEDTVPYLRSVISQVSLAQNNYTKMLLLKGTNSSSDNSQPKRSQTLPYLAAAARAMSGLSFGRYNPSPTAVYKPMRSTSGLDTAPLSPSLYAGFGVSQQDQERLERWVGSSAEDVKQVIRAVYRQVLGNPHLMEGDIPASLESQLIDGKLSVRAFVRELCLTDHYQQRFFAKSSPYRFVELLFKQLLGRAPENQAEFRVPLDIVIRQGYTATIDYFVNSAEYINSFGENVVPYLRAVKSEQGRSQSNFNRTLALVNGFSGGDRQLTSSRLLNQVTGGANQIIPLRSTASSGSMQPPGKRYRIEVTSQTFGSRRRKATTTYEVAGDRMTSQLKFIHSTSGRILSISEIV
ncbi:phycobilisome rod-core linker polypeptide [Synechococcus sp. CS-1326]|uniref:phycobilisome rod-core linker polypeptide n=1 Tax=Synechococcus sp. CS-1326 TaxID=2847978 RepID=UPI00223AAFB8|nr:phycobilisome rod-core linker polypeptide [Synechococcus sp. CS-1326]MCT0213219.1 phycobilisome rod-core linker polypeptide [Synechococcus sp. CS-1326]